MENEVNSPRWVEQINGLMILASLFTIPIGIIYLTQNPLRDAPIAFLIMFIPILLDIAFFVALIGLTLVFGVGD